MQFSDLLTKWRNFWFEKQPPTAIAIYRILLGLFVLETTLLEIAPNFSYFYGEKAIVNIGTISSYWWQRNPVFDLFLLVPQKDCYLIIIFALIIIAAVGLTLGLFTRLSSIIVYLGLLSLDRQCPFVLDGGDELMRLGSLIICFSNAGAAYSIDSLLRGQKEIPLVSPWAQRLLQVQVSIAYFFAFLNKVVGHQWQNGTAVYYVANLDDFIKSPTTLILANMFFSVILTYYTLAIEFALAVLVWFKPLRYWILLGGVFLHAGIDSCMNLPGFQWFFVSNYILFVEPADIARVIGQIKAFAHKFVSELPRSLYPWAGALKK